VYILTVSLIFHISTTQYVQLYIRTEIVKTTRPAIYNT